MTIKVSAFGRCGVAAQHLKALVTATVFNDLCTSRQIPRPANMTAAAVGSAGLYVFYSYKLSRFKCSTQSLKLKVHLQMAAEPGSEAVHMGE